MTSEERKSFWARVYEDNYLHLISFLTKHVRNEADASDIAQETYLRLIKFEDTHLIACHKSYLFRTARNLAVNVSVSNERYFNHLNKIAQMGEEINSTSASQSDEPEYCFNLQRLADIIGSAVDELPMKSRRAFSMHKFQNYTYPQIAKILGVSQNTVEKQISLGMNRCREKVQLEVAC